MNLPYFIAKRYLFSKKSHNIINVISAISVAGVTVGSFALIVVLSVFNGFEGLVSSLFNTFNPEIRITLKEGKTFHFTQELKDQLKHIDGIEFVSGTLEENALLKYRDKQFIATIKGVDDEYVMISRLDSMMIDGQYRQDNGELSQALAGSGVALYLDLRAGDLLNLLEVYVPLRGNQNSLSADNQFNVEQIQVAGVFSVQQEFDSRYVIVPIDFARTLLNYSDEVTAVEIGLQKGVQVNDIKPALSGMLGSSYIIEDRFEQQKLLYSVMRTEKWAIFLILTFILILASFNVIGSISILILDKKDDISILSHMGSTKSLIKMIFLTEGVLISFGGAVIGLVVGALVCIIQQEFGLIKLGGSGSFVVDAYPVKIEFRDILVVFLTVLSIGFLTVWYPVHRISSEFLRINRF